MLPNARLRYTDCVAPYPLPHNLPLKTGDHVTFQIGDKVIYPNHGLGVIERIEEKTILGTTCGFYHLRISSNDTTVLVPLTNADNVGLRPAIGNGEVERLFKVLGDGKIDSQQNWKGRFKDNSDRMRTGSIYDVAEVLKSLTLLSRGKTLSFREKRMLDRARFLIVSEVSEVIAEAASSVEARMDNALDRCITSRQRTALRTRVTVSTTVKALPQKAAAAPPRRSARAS